MTNTLELINKEGKMAYILGDYNLDLFKSKTHSPTLDFLNNLYSNYFYPIITVPTRVTEKSATLIDNILTNSGDKVLSSGTLCVDISDHFPVFQISLEEGKKEKQFPGKTIYRKFSEKSITTFKKLIDGLSWENVYIQTDVNCAYQAFIESFNSIFDKCFPLVTAQKARKQDFLSLGLLVRYKSPQRKKMAFIRNLYKIPLPSTK